ncbi:hypothetical protein [Orrella daihaiensis]|uniref:Uncharacterized protein n=1 Tax=Orrella daihaiensis TaxID=2782176 RepID=A0ABY4ALR3_9BURK|nr:hypothetical protein [Orrella daihaiensis]UOD50035.1 hypothetical protein DHf2319_11425 [Orrella daihaiensis]
MKSQLDPASVAAHEELFDTQVTLQSRLLDYIEQVGELQILDEAWDEFNLYESITMDLEDPEPALHFFPWALFYWRRDVSESALEAGLEEMLAGVKDFPENELDDSDHNSFKEIEVLSNEDIDEILSDSLDDDEMANEDEDEPQIALPPIAIMFMNSVDGADGPDSPAANLVLSVKERQFIEAAAQAPYSFFKVNAVGPGPFVILEDLIVPQKRQVYAQVLVDMLEEGDVIYAQVVSANDMHLLCGVAPAVLPEFVQEAVADAHSRIAPIINELGESWHLELDFEMRALYQMLISDLQALEDDEDGNDSESFKAH